MTGEAVASRQPVSGEVLPASADSQAMTPLPGKPAPAELTVPELVSQVRLIQEAMREVMKNGEHYGVIPGTQKPTLLKPGAEKLCLLFRLSPSFEETGSVHKPDFIAYRMRCVLTHIPSGQTMGEGMGSCNSREKKYKSQDAWNIDNTLLKMACKRALVAAVLVATAASDIFTQDVEDMARSSAASSDKKATRPQHAKLGALVARLDKEMPREPVDGEPDSWEDYSRDYAKTTFGKHSRADLTTGEMSLLIEHVQDQSVPF